MKFAKVMFYKCLSGGGDVCPGVSVQGVSVWGVSVQEGLCQGDSPYDKVKS